MNQLKPKNSLIKIIHGREITEQHLRDGLAIDSINYAAADLATLETCLAWQAQNPDIYSAIVETSTDQLLGYINLMPVSQEALDLLLGPNFHDVNFEPSMIVKYDQPGAKFIGYVSSVARVAKHPALPKLAPGEPSYIERLFHAKLENLAAKGVRFDVIWGRAITDKGAQFGRKFGFKPQAGETFWKLELPR